MSSKKTFEAKTFAANTFACGTFRGIGVDVAPPTPTLFPALRGLLNANVPLRGVLNANVPLRGRP